MTRYAACALLWVLLMMPAPLRADDGVRLSLTSPKSAYRAGENILLTWSLVNRTSRAWTVLAGENDSDALTIRIETAAGRTLGRFQLAVPRGAARPEFIVLPPGAGLMRSFSLSQFAAIYGIRLGPGQYIVHASYRLPSGPPASSDRDAPLWPGEATAPPLPPALM